MTDPPSSSNLCTTPDCVRLSAGGVSGTCCWRCEATAHGDKRDLGHSIRCDERERHKKDGDQ